MFHSENNTEWPLVFRREYRFEFLYQSSGLDYDIKGAIALIWMPTVSLFFDELNVTFSQIGIKISQV
jgi:hypothetical protein